MKNLIRSIKMVYYKARMKYWTKKLDYYWVKKNDYLMARYSIDMRQIYSDRLADL